MNLETGIAILALAGLLLNCAGTARRKHPVRTLLLNEPVRTTVDSALAREFLRGDPVNPTSPEIRAILEKYRAKKLNNRTLKELAEETSIDFGAAYFIHRIWNNPEHLGLQKRFHAHVRAIKKERYESPRIARTIPAAMSANKDEYVFLFVPGLLYESKPETKGDLAGPRKTIRDRGFRTELVGIKEAGTVEENGRIIAAAIRRHGNSRVVLVSTSKGGPDVAYALGTVLKKRQLTHVRAWVSVGGVLRGSHLADKTMGSFDYWLLRIYGLFKGFDVPALVRGLTIKESLARFRKQKIPEHIYILHYVSVPFSGSVIKQVKQPYNYMKRFGPNDGIVLLSDQILKNGHVVLAVGFDHWFRDPEIDIKTLALTRLVLEETSTSKKLKSAARRNSVFPSSESENRKLRRPEQRRP